jgi:hypothetical protein
MVQSRSLRKSVSRKAAMIAANEHCLFRYPAAYTGGPARRVVLADATLWIVPVCLTSPGYGVVGDVGMVAVDASSGRVVGSTPRNEVVAAGTRLRKGKCDEIEAAFLRARTA